MHIALVANRSAGTLRRMPIPPTLAALCDALAEGGHAVTPHVVGRRDLARLLSSLASRPEVDAVVVAGGDGSVLTAIVAGLGRDKPLGILPLGTLNLLARDLGLPRDPVEAARALGSGRVACIDLAEVNGLPFAIWASLGMHPWVVRRRDHMQRDGMRKWRAMLVAALRAFRRYPLVEAVLDLPDGPHAVTTPMLFITNNPWRDETPPLSRESLDAGTLVIHAAQCRNRLSLLWLAAETVLGHWRDSRRIQTYLAREVRVTSRKHRMMVSLDGEVTILASPLVFKARPGGLRMLMPGRGETPP